MGMSGEMHVSPMRYKLMAKIIRMAQVIVLTVLGIMMFRATKLLIMLITKEPAG